MSEFTTVAPYASKYKTGRKFISPCCTASITEFLLPSGRTMLAGSVAGHGWSQPYAGTIDGINDTGTKVDADGAERACHWVMKEGE